MNFDLCYKIHIHDVTATVLYLASSLHCDVIKTSTMQPELVLVFFIALSLLQPKVVKNEPCPIFFSEKPKFG